MFGFLDIIKGLVKKQLQKRAVKTMMGLGQHFRKMDSSGDGLLDRHELQKALEAYHIRIPDEVSIIFSGRHLSLFVLILFVTYNYFDSS